MKEEVVVHTVSEQTSESGREDAPPDEAFIIEDPEWVMTWTAAEQERHNKPAEEPRFEEERGLAVLLNTEAVFLNDHWWKDDWPKDARRTVSLNVNCNDVFAWGCADAEEMTYADIEDVYQHWKKDRVNGTTIWCIKRRKELPQRPVAKSIQAGGVWDLDALTKEFGLRPNHYDGVSGVFAGRKYAAYCAWMASLGKKAVKWTAGWWQTGWKPFTEAHPDWCDDAWKAADDAAREKWRIDNGHADVGGAEQPSTLDTEDAHRMTNNTDRTTP